MNPFKNVSLNNLYMFKLCDLFAYDVKLRIQRSKEGGYSDAKVGSRFGVIMSFVLLGLTI